MDPQSTVVSAKLSSTKFTESYIAPACSHGVKSNAWSRGSRRGVCKNLNTLIKFARSVSAESAGAQNIRSTRARCMLESADNSQRNSHAQCSIVGQPASKHHIGSQLIFLPRHLAYRLKYLASSPNPWPRGRVVRRAPR